MKTSVTEGGRVIPGPGASPRLDRSMGAMLVDAGRISAEDAERILRYAKENELRFGAAALALRLVTQEDIQQALARQFDYPYLRPGESNVSHKVAAAWSPFSGQVEAMRALRSQLLLRWFVGEIGKHAVAVTSHARGDGRSHLAANLAVVFSQMGERTLLIDADLRNPCQHELFGIGNATGLSTVLSDRGGVEAIQRVNGLVDLSILPSGATPPNPLELLARANFGKLIADLAATYDVIIIDTPPAESGSDFQLVASKTHAALLIARRNHSTVEQCAHVAASIVAAGASVVGTVLNEK